MVLEGGGRRCANLGLGGKLELPTLGRGGQEVGLKVGVRHLLEDPTIRPVEKQHLLGLGYL